MNDKDFSQRNSIGTLTVNGKDHCTSIYHRTWLNSIACIQADSWNRYVVTVTVTI